MTHALLKDYVRATNLELSYLNTRIYFQNVLSLNEKFNGGHQLLFKNDMRYTVEP